MSSLTATNGTATNGKVAHGTATNGISHGTAPWPIVMLRVEQIDASPYQPRLVFDSQELEELVQSVRAQGVQQPVLVRTVQVIADEATGKPGRRAPLRYELIAGERRLRACRIAERKTLPAIVRDDLSDAQAAELCLLENVQRSGLSAIEEARGYKRLMLDFRLKEERLAKKVGKSVPVLREMMKLLLLPSGVQELLIKRQLTPAHGHELLRLAGAPDVCQAVASYAVLHGVTAAALGRDVLPNARELEKRSQIVSIDYRTKFDRTLCRECPHKAHLTSGHSSYCLKPDEWKRKQLEAQMRQSDEASRVLEEARQKADEAHRAASLGASSGDGEGASDVTGDPGMTDEDSEEGCEDATCHLPLLSDLPRGDYRDLRWGEVPPTCTPACPCRGLARDERGGDDHNGDERDEEAPVAVCLDPKRFQEQVRAERERKEEEKRRHFAALSGQAVARLTTQWGEGQRQPVLALLLLPFLDGRSVRRGHMDAHHWETMWRDLGERLGIALPWDELFDDDTSEPDQLRLLCETASAIQGEASDAMRPMLLVAALLLTLEAQEAARWGEGTPLIGFVLEQGAASQMALAIGEGEASVSPGHEWSDPDFYSDDLTAGDFLSPDEDSENEDEDEDGAECADAMEADFCHSEALRDPTLEATQSAEATATT